MVTKSKTVLGVWLVVVLISLWIVIRFLQVSTHITQFMPQAGSDTGRFLLEQLQSGAGSRLILMAISAKQGEPDAQQIAGLSREFTRILRGTDLFVEVNNGAAVLDRDTRKLLFRYRYLLSPNVSAAYFSEENLRNTLQQRYRELASPIAAVSAQTLGQDPGNDFFTVLSRLQSQDLTQNQNPLQRDIWYSQQAGMAFILAKTKVDGFALDEQQALQQTIVERFSRLEAAREYRLQMSGPGVIAVHTQMQIKRDVQWLTIIASVTVILLLLLVYRSVRVVLVNILPLMTAMVVAAAAATLLFPEVHGITLAFGMTIIGVAIDYPIHVFSHLSGSDNVQRDLQRIWPTLRLGLITSCSGYLALLATDFNGLTQLVVFSVTGLVAAMLFTRWVLPVLLQGRIQHMPVARVPQRLAARLLKPTQVKRLAALACTVVVVGYCVMNQDRLWEQDIASLSPIPKQAIRLDRQLRDAMGVADFSHLLLVQTQDLESLLIRCEILENKMTPLIESGVLQGAEFLTHLLPSRQQQAQRQAALPDEDELSHRMNAALQGLHFKAGIFKTFIDDVQQSRHLPLLGAQDLEQTILATRLDALLLQREGKWYGIVPLFGLKDVQALQKWLSQQGQDNIRYVNIKSATNELVSNFRDQALQRMQWGLLLIVAVLWLGLRSLRKLVTVIVPVLASMALTVAVLLATGQALSLFNLVALLLVFGIGVDYSLFFNRDDAQYHYRLQTLHALMVCAISTVSVFGILSLSDIPVLQDIGRTVAIGVVASFFFSMAIAQSRVVTDKPVTSP